VGLVATVVDLAVLAALVEVFALSPQLANLPALAAGAVVQFIGCRHLVFAAAEGDLRRQITGFAATELATLALNGLSFHLLVTFTPVPYPLARPVGTFLVFILFSFPMWRLVFRRPLA
jgi:putative flippase GtrA